MLYSASHNVAQETAEGYSLGIVFLFPLFKKVFYSFNFMLMQVSLLQAQELLLLSLGKRNGLKQSIMEKLCKSPCTVNQANRQTSAFFHKGQTQPAVRRKKRDTSAQQGNLVAMHSQNVSTEILNIGGRFAFVDGTNKNLTKKSPLTLLHAPNLPISGVSTLAC